MKLSSAWSISLGVPLRSPLGAGWDVSPRFACSVGTTTGSAWSPLPPLAPVLGSEVQTLGVNAEEPLEHGPLVPIHDVLRQREDILALGGRQEQTGQPTGAGTLRPSACPSPLLTSHLVVVDEVEVLQSRDDILLLDAGDFTDLAVGGQRSGSLGAFTSAPGPQSHRSYKAWEQALPCSLRQVGPGSLDGDLRPLPAV